MVAVTNDNHDDDHDHDDHFLVLVPEKSAARLLSSVVRRQVEVLLFMMTILHSKTLGTALNSKSYAARGTSVRPLPPRALQIGQHPTFTTCRVWGRVALECVGVLARGWCFRNRGFRAHNRQPLNLCRASNEAEPPHAPHPGTWPAPLRRGLLADPPKLSAPGCSIAALCRYSILNTKPPK